MMKLCRKDRIKTNPHPTKEARVEERQVQASDQWAAAALATTMLQQQRYHNNNISSNNNRQWKSLSDTQQKLTSTKSIKRLSVYCKCQHLWPRRCDRHSTKDKQEQTFSTAQCFIEQKGQNSLDEWTAVPKAPDMFLTNAGTTDYLGPVSWRPTTVKWRQFWQTNRHSTIKPSILKRYHRRRTCGHTSPRRSPTIVTLHDSRFAECRWWNKVGLRKLSSLDGRRPPWYRPLIT